MAITYVIYYRKVVSAYSEHELYVNHGLSPAFFILACPPLGVVNSFMFLSDRLPVLF